MFSSMESRCVVCCVIFLPVAGCLAPTIPAHITYVHRQIDQAALVPAPSGPRAIGPMVVEGHPALEAGLQLDDTERSRGSRADGQSGHVVPTGVGYLRLAGTTGPAE